MAPQTALRRGLPLLLLFLWSPLGGRSLPLSSPDPIWEQFVVLLDGMPVTDAELQGEQMTQRPLQQDRRATTEGCEDKREDATGAHEPQTFEQERRSEQTGCFGQKIDRISHVTRMGCNVLDKHPKEDLEGGISSK